MYLLQGLRLLRLTLLRGPHDLPGFTFKRSIWGLYSGPLLFCLGSRPRALFCDAVAMFLLLHSRKMWSPWCQGDAQ